MTQTKSAKSIQTKLKHQIHLDQNDFTKLYQSDTD